MILTAIETLRPRQWLKNIFVFAALVFSVRLASPDSLLKSLEAFGIFCFLSSAGYIINDIFDAQADRHHPVKCRRPIASGRLGIRLAQFIAGLLLAVSFWLVLMDSDGHRGGNLAKPPFIWIAASFMALQILYSASLKKAIILDALAIAAGFVLRMMAGAAALNVVISGWLYICTISLALFIAFCKRRAEMSELETPADHRPVLGQYSVYLLDQMISALAVSTIIAYALYTVADTTAVKIDSRNMILTVPFVAYGVFRYLYLVHQKQQGGEPETIVLSDKPLIINMLLWMITVIAVLY